MRGGDIIGKKKRRRAGFKQKQLPAPQQSKWKTKPTSVAYLDHMEAADNAFDPKRLSLRCSQSIPRLFQILKSAGATIYGDDGAQHAHLDRGCSVLAVAHLDYVCQSVGWGKIRMDDDTYIFNPRLDDRLGVYTILDLLPAIGVATDVLFTENEEVGATTAADFVTDREYNWIVEFDRRDGGVVLYQYGEDGWRETLGEYFEINYGSFSDIRRLEHLGCKAVNVGVGYSGEHTKMCHMNVETYIQQMATFKAFFSAHKDTKFPHSERLVVRSPSVPRHNVSSGHDSEYDRMYAKGYSWRKCFKCKTYNSPRRLVACSTPEFDDGDICTDCLSHYDLEVCKECDIPRPQKGFQELLGFRMCETCAEVLEDSDSDKDTPSDEGLSKPELFEVCCICRNTLEGELLDGAVFWSNYAFCTNCKHVLAY